MQIVCMSVCSVCVCVCAGRQIGGMKHNCTLCLSSFEKNAAAYVSMHQAVVTFTEEAFLQDTNRGQYCFSIYTSSFFFFVTFPFKGVILYAYK